MPVQELPAESCQEAECWRAPGGIQDPLLQQNLQTFFTCNQCSKAKANRSLGSDHRTHWSMSAPHGCLRHFLQWELEVLLSGSGSAHLVPPAQEADIGPAEEVKDQFSKTSSRKIND